MDKMASGVAQSPPLIAEANQTVWSCTGGSAKFGDCSHGMRPSQEAATYWLRGDLLGETDLHCSDLYKEGNPMRVVVQQRLENQTSLKNGTGLSDPMFVCVCQYTNTYADQISCTGCNAPCLIGLASIVVLGLGSCTLVALYGLRLTLLVIRSPKIKVEANAMLSSLFVSTAGCIWMFLWALSITMCTRTGCRSQLCTTALVGKSSTVER